MHSCQSQLGAAVGILIPSWKKPNFLKSALLRRRICQSWFYFCKDFPRDLGITLGHGLTSKCFSWFCFAQTRRGVIGRRALTNISAASATSKTAACQACCKTADILSPPARRWRRSRAIRLDRQVSGSRTLLAFQIEPKCLPLLPKVCAR